MGRNTNEVVIWYDQMLAENALNVANMMPKDNSLAGQSLDALKYVGGAVLSSALSIIGYESDDTEEGELGNVWFQNVRSQQRSRSTKVPLENGQIIYDSKVIDPAIITMRIAIKRYKNDLANELMHLIPGTGKMPETWQDTYLKLKWMYDAAIYSEYGGEAYKADEAKSTNVSNFMTDFTSNKSIMSNGAFADTKAYPYCMIQTGSQIYKNMSLTSLISVEDTEHYDYLQYDLEFTQHLVVGSQQEVLPKSAKDAKTITVGNVLGTAVTQGIGVVTSMATLV